MGAVVLNKARELFFTYGLKSISMDDLARQSGVSKKTIYQAVADKQELVAKVVEDLILCHKEAVAKSSQSAENAIEEVAQLSCLPFDTLAAININFFYELEKFFPTEWKKLLEHRQTFMLPTIIKNLKRGISEGLYRDDLDVDFTARIRLQQIATALKPVDFSDRKIEPRRLMNELTLFYLHGIVTTKGKRFINKYLNLNNENRTIQ
jgi:AcrR family transcriptional regulator